MRVARLAMPIFPEALKAYKTHFSQNNKTKSDVQGLNKPGHEKNCSKWKKSTLIRKMRYYAKKSVRLW